MKTQSYRKGWAFVLTLTMVFTTLFGGFGFLGIDGVVGEVYAATPRTTTLDLRVEGSADNIESGGWAWDNTSNILTLSGINLSTDSAKALIVPADTTIVLEGANSIVSTGYDGSEGSSGIYALNGLTINGTGTLNVTGADASGTVSYGINVHTGDLTIDGGTITATGGIGNSSFGIALYEGTLSINGGTVNTIGGQGSLSFGIWAAGDIVISGGNLTAETMNLASLDDIGIRAVNMTISGSADVKSSGKLYGAYLTDTLTMSGSGAKLSAKADSTIHANSFGLRANNITISEASLTATGGAVTNASGVSSGIFIDTNLTINSGTISSNGGAVDTGTSSGIKASGAGTIDFNGGTINATAGSASKQYAVLADNANNINFGAGPATMVTAPVGGGLSSDGKFIATISGGAVAADSVTIGTYVAAAGDVVWGDGTTLGDITVTDGAIINVTGNVTLTGTITISGSAIITGGGIIKAGTGFALDEVIIRVKPGSILTLSGVTIDGDLKTGLTGVFTEGTLDMCGDVKITNCMRRGVEVRGTGVLNMHDNSIISDCHQNGIFNMGTTNIDGNAEITNCSNSDSGGIYNGNWATLNMSGSAKITSCAAIGTYDDGGGVYNAFGSTFCVSGDINITGNVDSGMGPSNIFVNNTYVQITGSGLTLSASLGIKAQNIDLITGSATVAVITGSATHAVTAADAAYFSSDSSDHFITYSSIVADNALLLVANGWTPPVKNGTPTAIFDASSMTLSGLTPVTMQYSTNGGVLWTTAAASSISMSGVTIANGIQIKAPANSGLNTLDSDVQTVTLTKAVTPIAGTFTVTDPTTISGTGTIDGITVAMEYSTNGGSSWTTGVNPLSGLAGGTTVLVRVKGSGTVLASDNQPLTIIAYVPTVETKPTAEFEASTMTLSNISSGMKYSLNGGTSYINITSNGSITISGVTAASGIKVYKAGDGTNTTNSAIQTITITKAATPVTDAFTVTQPSTVGGTGTIAGITAAMEYSINNGSSWIAGGSTVSDLVGSTTALIRIKGAGTVLASDNYTITINAYVPTTLTNNSFEIPALGETDGGWWTNYITDTESKKNEFGWRTTATDETFEVGGEWNIPDWGIQFIPDGRQFIELNATTQAAVYQDLSTTPGSIIYWSLYQGGVWYDDNVGGKTINNTMAVRSGSPEQLSTSAILIQMTDTGYDQSWTTRTIYDNTTMTAINTTPTTYGAMELTKKILYTEPQRWTKYEGTYTVPAGQTETRFAFASLSAKPNQGNLLDGVVFRVANTTKAVTAFNFNGLTPNVTGTVNELTKTIALTVPYGTDVTALVPTITHSGLSITSSSGIAKDFTSPVIYAVTAEDNSTQEYTVTVTVAANSAKAITAFNLNGLTPNVTGTVNEGAKTIALNVPYGTDVTALVPTITHSGVSITSNSGIAQNFTSPVTYTVTAADSSTQVYTVTVTVASNGDGGSGGGHSSTPTAPANATVTVNGQSQDAGITSTSKVGDKTVTTVTIDDKKIQEKIKEEGNQSTVSIPISGSSDIGEGVLNGQTIKDMENKESVLEIRTNSTTYTLPASEINIDSVSAQLGQAVELKDIKISVRIAEPSADTTKIVQDTANKNNYQVVVKPVDFEITCTSGSKTVTVSKFNGYVERMVAIPDGIDPSKVTTGIVLNNDGTFSHVPTTIVKIDGKYYAKINSLTNSTYSVIYNPIEFADAAKHWAKDSINEMGSRLVISGVGSNNYEPNRDITRAEFAAIMVRALGLAPDTAKNNFSDVADSKWYSGYVGTAASYGIISGYDTDTFAPNDKITREQAMTMVARAMAITDLVATTTDLNSGTPLTAYTDTSKISGYAKAGIIACLNTGVVTGKTADTIAPKNNITRAEVAVIIERLLKKSELI